MDFPKSSPALRKLPFGRMRPDAINNINHPNDTACLCIIRHADAMLPLVSSSFIGVKSANVELA